MDPRRTPKRVLSAHPPDQIAQLTIELRPPYPTSGLPAPKRSEAGAMPSQNGLRLHHLGCAEQARPNPRHPSQQRPVNTAQAQPMWRLPQCTGSRFKRAPRLEQIDDEHPSEFRLQASEFSKDGTKSAGFTPLDNRRPNTRMPARPARGSTSTELKSPQRPHCRLIFIGSLMIGVVACASALMPCALSSALVMGGCRGLGLNGAMVPLVLCRQYVCSPEQPLYSPPDGDATILSYDANSGRIEFSERTTSNAW
jgi:hypothetical protein